VCPASRLWVCASRCSQVSVVKSNTSHNDTGQEQNDALTFSKALPVLHTPWIPPVETSSDQALQKLRGWIQECVEHHDSCQKSQLSDLPKRILKIEGTNLYLREQVTMRAKYACLSHCWGPAGPALKLTGTSLPQPKGGILIEHLPKTFREAVLLCARLGLRFIWIDALCKFLSTGCSGNSYLSCMPRY
jgi:hypothetical protein